MLRRLSSRNVKDLELPLTTNGHMHTRDHNVCRSFPKAPVLNPYKEKDESIRNTSWKNSIFICLILGYCRSFGWPLVNISLNDVDVWETLKSRIPSGDNNTCRNLRIDLSQDDSELLRSLSAKNEELKKKLKRVSSARRVYDEKIERLVISLAELDRQKDALQTEMEEHANIMNGDSVEEAHRAREEVLKRQLERLVSRVQRESHREILDRFGEGPHKIRFDVHLPSHHGMQNHTYQQSAMKRSVTFELAPIDVMPHTVHLFVEQVVHGLWERCNLSVSNHGVIQSRCHHRQAFKDLELDSLSFNEEGVEYDDEKYAIGFVGNGPDFFVSTGYWADVVPLFGRVVDGSDVIDDMFEWGTEAVVIEAFLL